MDGRKAEGDGGIALRPCLSPWLQHPATVSNHTPTTIQVVMHKHPGAQNNQYRQTHALTPAIHTPAVDACAAPAAEQRGYLPSSIKKGGRAGTHKKEKKIHLETRTVRTN